MEAVIWFGIAAIVVIAVVIAAIDRPGNGPGGAPDAPADREPVGTGGRV